MKKKFYVYIYLDPRKQGNFTYNNLTFNYEPFYVGKGCGNRLNFHLYESSNTKSKIRYNKIKSIRKCGLEPIVIKIKDYLFEYESLDFEREIIKNIGRKDLNEEPLINLTNGGEGESGYVWTDENKKNLSNSLKNSKKFKDSMASYENKIKTSESLKKFYKLNPHNKKGVKRTKDEINKIVKTLSIEYSIKTPYGDIIGLVGTKNVYKYFNELNDTLLLKGRFRISPDSIMYKNGSKGYFLIKKNNNNRNMTWSKEKKQKHSENNSKTKNNNACKYIVKCPNNEIKEFSGRDGLKKYFDDLNKGILFLNKKIGYETLINKGINKDYEIIDKIKIYKNNI